MIRAVPGCIGLIAVLRGRNGIGMIHLIMSNLVGNRLLKMEVDM